MKPDDMKIILLVEIASSLVRTGLISKEIEGCQRFMSNLRYDKSKFVIVRNFETPTIIRSANEATI